MLGEESFERSDDHLERAYNNITRLFRVASFILEG